MPTTFRHNRAPRAFRPKVPFFYSKGTTNTYTYSPTGGIVFGGSATASVTLVTYTVTGSGGIVFAGSATITRTYIGIVSGGITFGGTADAHRAITIIPTGGITFGGSASVTSLLVTPTVTTVEGVTRNQIFKRFLRETGLGVYGTVTGVGGGGTTTFDDTTRLKSSQFTAQDWPGAWARISKNANSIGNAPENEVFAISTYDPTTNGRVTVGGTFSSAIEVSDEYEIWRFPNPKSVIDDLDVVLQEDIFLPCWSVLSDHPDFDMEQNNTTDWEATTGSISKVSTGPFINGKRYLALTDTSGAGVCRSANEIKVEPNKKYHASIIGYAGDDSNTLSLSIYDVTNAETISGYSSNWDRQYPGRMVVEFTTPSTCYSVKLQLTSLGSGSAISYWDDAVFYCMDSYDIALPWWVKNKDQIKAIFELDMTQIGTNVYEPFMRGNIVNKYNIRDDAFGSGQLRLVAENGSLNKPIFIFGVRNEIAFANDTVDTKRVDANLIIACLAYKVFKRLKVFPNSNAMQTSWIQQQYQEWEVLYKRLSRQQSERIENIIQTVPASGYYSDQRFSWGN